MSEPRVVEAIDPEEAFSILSDGETGTIEVARRNEAVQVHDGAIHYVHEDTGTVYEERSSITYAAAVDSPVLVVQGANDPRVPRSEAERLVSSLDERDVPCEYVRFEDEGHGVRRTDNRIEYVSRIVSVFEANLSDSL